MKKYNDANIKKIVTLLEKRDRTLSNVVRRAGRIGIEKEEAIDAMDLLVDLEVLGSKTVEVGDGWNTRDEEKRYFIK